MNEMDDIFLLEQTKRWYPVDYEPKCSPEAEELARTLTPRQKGLLAQLIGNAFENEDPMILRACLLHPSVFEADLRQGNRVLDRVDDGKLY